MLIDDDQRVRVDTAPGPAELRMARVGLDLTIRDLAALVSVNKATIVRLEAGNTVRASTINIVRDTLVAQGARFWLLNAAGEKAVSVSQN